MKVVHLISSVEEQYGGPSRSVRALAAEQARRHDVALWVTRLGAPAAGETQVHEGLPVTTFRRNWPDRFAPSRGMRHAALSTAADVFHHHALWLRTLHYAHLGARRAGGKLVVSPRGMMSAWAWGHHARRKRFARAWVHPGAFEAAAGWHATSGAEADEIRGLGFKQPICVAPNGVDAPVAAELDAAREHWRQACPATCSRRIALFYSRLHRKKRVLELIDAWVQHAPADWLLLIVGIPQDYTPEMLEAYALKMSAGDRVAVFSGLDRPPPYAVAQLFLLPSHNENFGLVIAEAMAHGVPVAVTDTTPWSAVEREQCGWWVSWPDFPAALAAATREDAAALAARGTRARDWVLREFSWERSARQLEEFYATLPPPSP